MHGTKSDIVPGGTAWLHGANEDEICSVDIVEEGYYCVAVWKVSNRHLDRDASFLLHASPCVTAVNEADRAPSMTQLRSVYPNPFNPCTNIAFDLAAPGPVDITIYDATGARVRRLLRGNWPAGRHLAVRDGKDDRGAEVASGVYLSKMVAGKVHGTRKMVLVR